MYTSVCASGDGIDAMGCDMLGLLSLSGTGLEKIYKFYGDQDSQSAPICIVCKNFTNNVNFLGCHTYLTLQLSVALY